MSDGPERELDEQGLVVVEDALSPALVSALTKAVDRIYDGERAARRLAADGSLHFLGAVARDEAFLELLDLPATFPLVCCALGWNIHMYHSHVDVHPPVDVEPEPWRWHQDGGRQNLELETDPRPRLSIKVGFFLSDVSEPDRGNLLVLPGSHRENRLDGRELGIRPREAVPVLARPGTAVVFDRRLWHARSDNHSALTRKVIFLGYTYRWIRPRDDAVIPAAMRLRCSPIRRQLLGEGTSPTGYWIPTDDDVPLRAVLQGA